jgi:hypothetical protein
MLHYGRAVKRLERRWRREALLEELRGMVPSVVYAGCLEFAVRQGSRKATGYAAHLFKDVFGEWPQHGDRGPPVPLPNFLIDQWATLRPKRRTNGATNGHAG